MKLFGPIYNKVIEYARHRHAVWYLGGLSFAESSFFPIPPDVMLAPMVLANKAKAWFYASVTTITSVLGGLLGYLIGAFFFEAYGPAMLDFFHAHEKFAQFQDLYKQYGMVIILMAGFTPIPYKVFTIASGVAGVAVLPFLLMSFLGRGARFFLVAGLIKLGGDNLESTIQSKVETIGWVSLVLVSIAVGAYVMLH